MSNNIRRRARRQKRSNGVVAKAKHSLRLESLESRLLLDVAGWWDELGWRSGSGGGISWDPTDLPGESQLALSSDGDPVIVWSEGTFTEYVDSPIPYYWEVEGDIYVRQYGGANIGWWDVGFGSGDPALDGSPSPIGSGRQIALDTGPSGEIVVAWVSGAGVDSEIGISMWDGSEWTNLEAFSGVSVGQEDEGEGDEGQTGSSTNSYLDDIAVEHPSVVVAGDEIFVSFTAMHPVSFQREIVVMRYGFVLSGDEDEGLDPDDKIWSEISSDDVGLFGDNSRSGVSNDLASSFDSKIAVDLEGKPIVAWTSITSQDQAEIYVKRWSGDEWLELGNGSASDLDGDGESGVSNDEGMSIQPDIAVAGNGDVFLTWVNWADWHNYDNPDTAGGQAGIYARTLVSGANTWTSFSTEFANSSVQDKGMAPTLGWYYTPAIDTDSNSQPLISWQGFGAGERYVADRDYSDTTPALPGNDSNESPIMAIYVSYYSSNQFSLLTNNIRDSISPIYDICWMPSVLVGANDELLTSYTWREAIIDGVNLDNEIYVQQWDSTNSEWISFGRGSNSNGNDVFAQADYIHWDSDMQLGLIDYNDNPQDPDVMTAVPGGLFENDFAVTGGWKYSTPNTGHIYRYDRTTDTWQTDIDTVSFGNTFDLRGEPEVEYNVAGNPLIAYLDDITGLPYVYQWTGAAWSVVDESTDVGDNASAIAGNTYTWNAGLDSWDYPNGNIGVSVQGGPDGTILLTYITHTTASALGGSKILGDSTSGSDEIVTLEWKPNIITGIWAWTPVGTNGYMAKSAGMGVGYYSDFDGFNFVNNQRDYSATSVEKVDLDDQGQAEPAQDDYETNVWYFRPDFTLAEDARGLVDGDVVGEVEEVWQGYTRTENDYALVMTFTDPKVDGDPAAAAGGSTLRGWFDYTQDLQTWGDDLVVELAYSFDATAVTAGMDFELYLEVDGTTVDMDTSTPGTDDPIASVTVDAIDAGANIIPFSINNTVTIDLQNQGVTPGAGRHIVSLRGEMGTITGTAIEDFNATIKVDNFAVYQRIVGQSGYDNSGTLTYPKTANPTFTYDNGTDDWVFDGDAQTFGTHDVDAGELGAGDGAIIITLGNGVNATANLEGWYEYQFQLPSAVISAELDISNYKIWAGADIGGAATTGLYVILDGVEIDANGVPAGNYVDQLAGPGTIAFTNSLNIALGALTAGNHTIALKAKLSTSAAATAGGDGFLQPFSDADPFNNIAALSFVDDPIYPAHVDADHNGTAANYAGIELGNGVNARPDDLSGEVTYTFTLTADTDLLLDFDYLLETTAAVPESSDTVEMSIAIIDAAGIRYPITLPGGVISSLTGQNQSTGVFQATSTIDVSAQLGSLAAGNYTFVVRGEFSNTLPPTSPDQGDGQAYVKIDNLQMRDKSRGIAKVTLDDITIDAGASGIMVPTGGKWQILPYGIAIEDVSGNVNVNDDDDAVGNTGGNSTVGPVNDDGISQFDFQGCLYTKLAGGGIGNTVMDTWLIEDLVSDEDGQMIIGFRYRMTTDGTAANTNLAVRIDGTLYDADGANAFVSTPVYEYAASYWATGDTGWWNGNNDDPEYCYVYVVADDIVAGQHDVRIELTVTDEADTITSELWVDDLVVLVARPTDAYQPLATLLPNRNFAVGLTNESPGLGVYADDDTDPNPDGTVRVWTGDGFTSAFYTASVFELDSATTWRQYGDNLVLDDSYESIDFIGFSLTNINGDTNIVWGDVASAGGLGTYTYRMPAGDEQYRMTDLAIGPNAVEWASLQRVTAEWVDTNDDQVNDRFDVHVWTDDENPGYWNEEFTEFDFEVWRWQPYNDPLNVNGDPDQWIDTELLPQEEYHAYSGVQLVSSGGQLPTVFWTQRGGLGTVHDIGVQRFDTDNTWTLLNTESVQNAGAYIEGSAASFGIWTSALTLDLIVRPDGFPIAGYYMGHLDCLGIREFREDAIQRALYITEESGQPDDYHLDLGETTAELLFSSFTLTNNGIDDLIIYDIEIAGLGTLTSNPFSLRQAPTFPLTLEPGESRSIGVRFDPENIPKGDYLGFLLVHNSDPHHASHPFGHYAEIGLHAKVLNDATVYVTPSALNFSDETVIGNTSDSQSVTVLNNGNDPLTIKEWKFQGNNFIVTKATVTSGIVVTDVSTTNSSWPSDDFTLASQSYLTLEIALDPDEVNIFNEVLAIHTDDDENDWVSVALTGSGISGAAIIVTENSGTTADDDIIDFGSVLMGQDKTETFTITNNGSSDLVIQSIVDQGNNTSITITDIDDELIENVTLASGALLDVYVTFSPPPNNQYNPLGPQELDTIFVISNDDPVLGNRQYDLEVIGWAVPDGAQILITNPDQIPDDDDDPDPASIILEFDDTTIGTPVTKQFYITNIGGDTLTIESFRFSYGGIDHFWADPQNLTGNDADDIDLAFDSGNEVITVTFNPQSTGQFNEDVYVYYYNANGALVAETVNLQAKAVNPAMQITDNQGSATDRSIDFGDVGVDCDSQIYTVTLTNTGSSNLNVLDWSLTAGNADEFVVQSYADVLGSVNPSGSSIIMQPGQSQPFEVQFTPTAQGSPTGTITITSDDPTNPTGDVSLLGSGVEAGVIMVVDQQGQMITEIDFTPNDPLVYGVGQTAQHIISIRNNSAVQLTVNSIDVSSGYFLLESPGETIDDPDDITTENPLILDVGQEYTMTVIFSAAGAYAESNDAKLSIVTVGQEQPTEIDLLASTIYGETINAGQKTTWEDDSGSSISIKLVGQGQAFIASENTTARGDISTIELSGTSAATKLIVSASSSTAISSISGSGLNSLVLKNVTIDGDGIVLDSVASSITVAALTNGADLVINDTPSKGVKIKVDSVGSGSDIYINGRVSNFQSKTFAQANFHANSAGNIKFSGAYLDATFIVAGDVKNIIASNAYFRGSLSANAIGSVKIGGMVGAQIAAVSINKINCTRDMVDSFVLSGYSLGADGMLGGGDDTLIAGGHLASINVKGRLDNGNISSGIQPNGVFDIFQPDATEYGTIGKVTLGSAATNGSTHFGIAAHTSIDKVLVGREKLTPPVDIGNFSLRII